MSVPSPRQAGYPGARALSLGETQRFARLQTMNKLFRGLFALTSLAALTTSCVMDRAPRGLRKTPQGPGATVRYDLGHKPLPEIPLPIDTATWPDPTSRTGLRVNASLVAPTDIEQQARERFSQMEGWGTFSPISVAFDVDRKDPEYASYEGPALDVANIKARHVGDDYDFANDAVYLINLATGLPTVVDLGAGSFNYTLKRLDKYWANDTRSTERNLLFDTIDESRGGALTKQSFTPADDTDFDGVMDVPALDDPRACPGPDPICDDARSAEFGGDACVETRRRRDRCIADHLTPFYERETDTLILRPLLPLDEMTRYAVVITDRTLDGKGHAVRSPFDFIYHAAQESAAQRVMDVINDGAKASYFGDLAGTGLDHVAFLWSFTTQPTVDDMKRLRDGLYGQGPFARWNKEFPPNIELTRAIGLEAGLSEGIEEEPDWQSSAAAEKAQCAAKMKRPYLIRYEDIRDQMRRLLVDGFGFDAGPGSELLLRSLDNIDHMFIGTYKTPFLLEGGPKSTDPNAAMHLNYQTGAGEVTSDEVQFWVIVPKETKQFKQPFNVNIYGHGYTGNFSELLLYAGNMAEHGLATVGINATGHGLVFDPIMKLGATALLGGACIAPFADALTLSRARDLDGDGQGDSGGDFWSSYLFHTRDSVRQSVLDHVQLVRILRAFGTSAGQMRCRNDQTGWGKPATAACDVDTDGEADVLGDFDGDGVADLGGANATYGTWGESLGGILSAIHGSIDPYVTSAVPGSGGGGLTDIGIRSFQGGVVEAVLLRMWGPLLVSVPASERKACADGGADRCTMCEADRLSLRWVMPDVNGTGEVEVGCLDPSAIDETTVYVENKTNGELRCARVDDAHRFRIGLPSTTGDRVEVRFYPGRDVVKSYGTCETTLAEGTLPKHVVNTWGAGPYANEATNELETDTCTAPSCRLFQGRFIGEGSLLTAPAEGLGQIRQSPALRRFIQLAQAALDPGDPISFAPYYAMKPMTDSFGHAIAPHAVLTLNTIGDMNVPLNSGIAFARATGALPFLRPDQAAKYPAFAAYATPTALYAALGNKTPNQALIDNHVIEGIAPLARHPAGAACAASQNAKDPDGTFLSTAGEVMACFPEGCTAETESDAKTRLCYYDTHCDVATSKCVPNALGQTKCDEALFDIDDLDEGKARYFEQSAAVPLRLARYMEPTSASSLDEAWAPRLKGAPFGPDGAWKPAGKRLNALLDAYVVPEGVHTFVNGEPCQSFDAGTYLTNLTAHFFMSDGTDLYYLSHPSSHHCLEDVATCGYLQK
jgi:hypothetical protein